MVRTRRFYPFITWIALLVGTSVPVIGNESSWLDRVQEDIRRAEYRFTDQDGRLQAPNRLHDLRTFVEASGLEVVSRTEGDERFRLRLELQAFGRPGRMNAVEPGVVDGNGRRVEILRQELVEWMINDEAGLEHGYTLPVRPEGDAVHAVLSLSLSGSLSAYPLGDRGIVLKDGAGRTLLYYDKLVVFDALERELPAWLEIGIGELRIVFDDSEAVYPVTVDPLLSTAGWSQTGAGSARFGTSVKTAGDVNGDGYSDIIVGAPGFDGGLTDEGKVYVFHGSAGGVSNFASWSFESDQFKGGLGRSVSTAGDVNGDGFHDVIVGAPDYDNGQAQEGRAWIFFGSSTGVTSTGAWSTESNQADAYLGTSVSFAGDVNGDGYHDVIIGAPFFDQTGVDNGRVFLHYGGPSGPDSIVDWQESTVKVGALFGSSVCGAGDINGDGFGDLLVGSPNYEAGTIGEGRVLIYTGSATGPAYSSGPDGDQLDAQYGASVSAAGDVNGDGYADVVIGAPLFDNGSALDVGKVEVLYGGPGGVTETGKTTILGQQGGDELGGSVATAGDVNGDGFADVVAGCSECSRGQLEEGAAYVFRGSSLGIRSFDAFLNGFEYWLAESDQAGAHFGASVATAGDVNGDGFSDVIVGAKDWSEPLQSGNGRAFVYHGGPDGLHDSALATRSDGQADSSFGSSMAHADVNGDGFSDVIVGDPTHDGGQVDEGAVFVYHGTRDGISASPTSTIEVGQAFAHFGAAVAGVGDMNGDGFDEVLVGAPEWDQTSADDGRMFLYNGSASGLSPGPSWANQQALSAGSRLGHAVAGLGDVNGDGYSDMAGGAPLYTGGQAAEGAVVVFFGSASGPSFAAPDRTIELNGTGDQFGFSLAGAGDVNNDGLSDFVVGAPYAFGFQLAAGEVYLFLGDPAGPSTIPIRSWKGDLQNGHFGWSVAGGGDVNGDGYSDFVAGEPDYESPDLTHPDEGRFLVYAGDPDPSNGLAVIGSREGNISDARFGISVANLGDANNDGYADVAASSPGNSLSSAWYGAPSGLGATSWATGSTNAVAGAGDVNGDGVDDLIYGLTGIGEVRLYYGGGVEGMDRIPRAQQPSGTGAPRIGLLGKSTSSSSTRLRTRARTAAGRDLVQVEYEVKSIHQAFDGQNTKFSSELLASGPLSDGSRVNYSTSVSGLTDGPHYRWRLRHLSSNPLFPRSPWVSHAGISANQKALLTSCAPQTWYFDSDGDGYGDLDVSLESCSVPAGYVGAGDDCDDEDPLVNPGQLEIACNAIDENCSGPDDDSADLDGDGFDPCNPGDPGDSDGLISDCDPGDGLLWGLPGEVIELRAEPFIDSIAFRWTPAVDRGTFRPLDYDVAHSTLANDFESAVADCAIANTFNDFWFPTEPVDPGEVRFYLIVGVNGCGRGPAGDDSLGNPRDVGVCAP